MKRLLAIGSILVTAYAIVVLVASITQLASFADRLHPAAGQVVFWVLLTTFGLLLVSPLILYFRLPPALVPPDERSGPQFEAFKAALRTRLASNPLLLSRTLATGEDLQAAIDVLAREAQLRVREAARAVFVSTAVMQNGRLDGLIVFATQVRLVLQVATIYFQRPSPRQLLYLYSNVGVTALIATNIEDIDFSNIVAPLAVAVVPSVKGAIPGMQGVSSLLVNSLANGTANAFLTLRVGAIACDYCGAMSTPQRDIVKRSATLSALAHVGQIAKENAGELVKAVWNAAATMPAEWLSSAVTNAKGLGTSISSRFRRRPAEGQTDNSD